MDMLMLKKKQTKFAYSYATAKDKLKNKLTDLYY